MPGLPSLVLTCWIAAASTAALLALQSDTRPAFDVARIRLNTSGSDAASFDFQRGGRFVASNASIAALIRTAYGDAGRPLANNRMDINRRWADGSAFLTSNRFDVEARGAEDLTRDEMQVALQRLLIDRFRLVLHKEQRELPIYRLTFARADKRLGPRLRPSDLDCSDARSGGTSGRCSFQSVPGKATGRTTIAALARWLTGTVEDHRRIEDRTNLAGSFEIDLEWSERASRLSAGTDARDDNAASLFTALQEQLGLRLEAAKGAIEVIVVDRAERPLPD